MPDLKSELERECRKIMLSLPKQRLAETTDDSTESQGSVKKEVTATTDKEGMVEDFPQALPPRKKTPEEMNQDPTDILDPPDENKFSDTELPGHVDEAKWAEAKEKAKSEYGYSQENPRFWKVVQHIYGVMTGSDDAKMSSNRLNQDFMYNGHEVEIFDMAVGGYTVEIDGDKIPGKFDSYESAKKAAIEEIKSKKMSRLATDYSKQWHDLCVEVCGHNCKPNSSPPIYHCFTESETDAKALSKAIKESDLFNFSEIADTPGGLTVKARGK